MDIRRERPADVGAIRRVHQLAFETDAEADLVEALRERARPIVSLVADIEGAIVGHIMFSPVTLSSDRNMLIMGLAPMAVLPARQREGIGSTLVRAGVEECVSLEAAAVFVLAHAAYYPRFGFRPASAYALASDYNVPDDVFMALELQAGVLGGKAGTIRYHDAFAGV